MTKLETITAEDLQNRTYEPTHFLVDELIPEGLHILAGAPKIGKSWLALWLCLCVAQGQALWNFATTQGEVLYLSLEDSFQRIQTRLFDLTEDAPPTLHFAIMADTLKRGLEQQIEQFLTEHPDTKLVVIDTLQRVRSTGNDNNLYANDYQDIGLLKRLADRRQIATLLMVQQKPTLRRRAGNAENRGFKMQRNPAAAGKILPFGRSQHRIWLVAGNRLPAKCGLRAEAHTHYFVTKSAARVTPCGRGHSTLRSLAPQFQTKSASLGFCLVEGNERYGGKNEKRQTIQHSDFRTRFRNDTPESSAGAHDAERLCDCVLSQKTHRDP